MEVFGFAMDSLADEELEIEPDVPFTEILNEENNYIVLKFDNKVDYESAYGIVHSRCYTEYGLKRTGCVGCPYGRDFEHELGIIKKYEPKLYKAVINIFKDSYEYTRKYREFIQHYSC